MDGGRILVIDSDESTVQLATFKLSGAGYWVMTAPDAGTALDKMQMTPPDLLLINYRLPDRSGLEFCAEHRGKPYLKNTPVILMIDAGFDEKKLKEFKINVEGILIKPFTPKNLLTKVNAAVLRRAMVRQVNPLTLLPGKMHLREALEYRLQENRPFDLVLSDLKGLAVFNKVYGYDRGDELIKLTAGVIEAELSKNEGTQATLYQLDGGCFAFMLNPGFADIICQSIIDRLSRELIACYDEEDRQRGGVVLKNRRGMVEQKPVMTISLGIVSNQNRPIANWLEAEALGAELLKYAKTMPGSRFVRDRRQS
jgi:DNA-binding response OmpR family regulator